MPSSSRTTAVGVLASALVVTAAAFDAQTRSGPPARAAATTAVPSHTPRPNTIVGVGLTRAEALALQQAVDQGHQPWRLDPQQVARTFAIAELGWHHLVVRQADPHTVEVTNLSTGAIVSLQLAQPVRQGPTGIWVVTRVDRIGRRAAPAKPIPGAPRFTG